MNSDPAGGEHLAAAIDRLTIVLHCNAAAIDRLTIALHCNAGAVDRLGEEIREFQRLVNRLIERLINDADGTLMSPPAWPEGYAGDDR